MVWTTIPFCFVKVLSLSPISIISMFSHELQKQVHFFLQQLDWVEGDKNSYKILFQTKWLKIELYHSCRLILIIFLQHNVVGNGCLYLEHLCILKPSLHSSGPQFHWNLVLCHQEMEFNSKAHHTTSCWKWIWDIPILTFVPLHFQRDFQLAWIFVDFIKVKIF